MNRLFVYGTLAPGEPNEHVLADLGGTWEPASIRGTLHAEGWGAALGYPVVMLDEAGEVVNGQLFTSPDLTEYWSELDEFEGAAYKREITTVKLADNSESSAFVYVFSQEDGSNS